MKINLPNGNLIFSSRSCSPAWFLWYGWGVTIIQPGMIIITVRKPIWSGSRPEAYHRPFPPPVPVSPKAIRSGREPIQRCF